MHLEISSDVWPFKGEFNEKEKEKYFRDIQTLRGIKKKRLQSDSIQIIKRCKNPT
jgi:hypothetical protein